MFQLFLSPFQDDVDDAFESPVESDHDEVDSDFDRPEEEDEPISDAEEEPKRRKRKIGYKVNTFIININIIPFLVKQNNKTDLNYG